MTRIIDKDIESYTAFVEAEEAMLRRCETSREGHYKSRLELLRVVLSSMKSYRAILDSVADRGSFTLILTTAKGLIGQRSLTDPHSLVSWIGGGGDVLSNDQVRIARFELRHPDGRTDAFEVDGEAWRHLVATGDLVELASDCVAGGAKVESALRAQLDVHYISYEHVGCGTAWTDKHSCACDDECPKCGTSVSPLTSTMLSGLGADQPARYFGDGEPGEEYVERPGTGI
jgi:hypothetical protein